MKNSKYYLTAGALFCSAFSGLALPMSNTFAEGASSFFDYNAQSCIIDSYNDENGTSVTKIEDVVFADVTILNCSNRNIVSFHGINLFPNLERLDISNNYNLQTYNMDFSQNTKLKEINIKGTQSSYFDFSANPELETIDTDRSLSLKTVAFVKRIDKTVGDTEYRYGINLADLKFVDPTSAQEILFQDVGDVRTPMVTFGGYSHYVSPRGGWAEYEIYLNGDEEVETHNPIYVRNNCKAEEDYYYCNDMVYYGDTFDTEGIVNNTLAKIFNLSEYQLTKVEIVPPTANVELTVNTDVIKKGMVLADSGFTLRFYFDLATDEISPSNTEAVDADTSTSSEADASSSTPETGAYTAESRGASAAVIAISVVVGIVTALAAFPIIRRIINR